MNNFVMVDVESDGPIPGDYSMISFGAVLASDTMRFFYGRLIPISDTWQPEALAVSGHTREECFKEPFFDARIVMLDFKDWLRREVKGRPMFISDNNGFDWQFINWYFWHFTGGNPFGFSSTNLGSLYKGYARNMFENFKHLRRTKHDHNPVNDAKGNVEAFRTILKDFSGCRAKG